MIRNRFLLLLALPMLALAGCSEDSTEPQTPGTNDTGTIAFEIGFAGQDGQTRVATAADFTSAFEDGDQIGIFAIESGQPLAANDNPIHNVPLTYNKTAGTWSGPAYWPTGAEHLSFFAYFPYDADATDPTAMAFTVKADQSGTTDGKSNYNLSDMLLGSSTNGGDGWAEGSTVPLMFSHMLAMVQFAIDEEADGIDFNEEMTVTLQGVKTAAPLDLSAGTSTADGDTSSVAMHRVPGTTDHIYRALVPAQTVAAGTKLFRIANGDRTLTSDALTAELSLTPANAYKFTLPGAGGGTPDPAIDNVLDEIANVNFKAALTELMNTGGWDTDENGKLSSAEAAAVTGAMDVSSKDIASLAGIEYFTALTRLNCYNNDLDALDVSKNTALTALDCFGNALTALDVTKNTALTALDCFGNALTALDVTKNTALTSLYCGDGSTALTVTVDAAEHDISTDGNLKVHASILSGGYTQITALDTPVNGVTVVGGAAPGGENVLAEIADANFKAALTAARN